MGLVLLNFRNLVFVRVSACVCVCVCVGACVWPPQALRRLVYHV